MTLEQGATVKDISITPSEQVQVDRATKWAATGAAYGDEHSTRPSTIALVLMTNLLAMAAW